MDAPERTLPPPVLVTANDQLQHWLDILQNEPRLAIDTESNSLYAYFYRVCLLQISVPAHDLLIDPLAPGLDVTPLGDLFADERVEKVLHAGDNDILMLQRDYGFRFARCFDTMLAARILGWPQVGLAAILEGQYGVRLDKRMQRTDWGQRPLDDEQLAYARLDTHFLLALRDVQADELQRRHRWREAQEAFAALEQIVWAEKEFDPEGYWRLHGAFRLRPQEIATLRELYLFRDEQARRLDVPPFKVMHDQTLLALAKVRPDSLRRLQEIEGIGPWHVRRFGKELLQAIARGNEGQTPAPPRRNHAPPPDPETLARFDLLRDWRAAKAEERGVEPDIVASNDVLMALAKARPLTKEALQKSSILTPWKQETYGPEILTLLQNHG